MMIEYLKKLNFILNKKVKKKIIFLSLLLFIGMFFEILGLGSLLPVLSLIASPDTLKNYPIISDINFLNQLTYNYLVLYLLIGIAVIYLFKTVFLSFLTFKQNRFLANITATISNDLFSSYLHQPYDYHVKFNSSGLIKNLQTEVNLLAAFNFAIITLVIEMGLLFSILITLIIIEPLGAISVGTFLGFLALIFYNISKKKLISWGNEREKTDGLLTKTAIEGLGAIKDIKLLNVEQFFISRFINNNYLKSRVSSNSNTVAQLPRYYLELISVFGLVLFIISMLYQNKDIPALIATIGVFVAAVFRLMPSLNKILTAFQNLKYYSTSVDIIYNEFLEARKNKIVQVENHQITFKDKIHFDTLSFKYNSASKFILKDVSFEINRGEMIGIIGESGAGKSSLVDLLNGLYQPTSGKIFVDGKNIHDNIKSWRKNIGYVAQDIYLTDDTIEKNIAFGINENDIDEILIKGAIKKAQMDPFINELRLGIKTFVGEKGIQISGGQKQRIGVARALYHNPEVLILDEATSALDDTTEQALMKGINALKGTKTIIIIAHRLTTLRACDRIFKIMDKQIKETKK